jgi:hypothetical protein
VPLAVTCAAIEPLPTVTVWNEIDVSPFAHGLLMIKNAATPATRANTTIRGIQRFMTCAG